MTTARKTKATVAGMMNRTTHTQHCEYLNIYNFLKHKHKQLIHGFLFSKHGELIVSRLVSTDSVIPTSQGESS